MKFQRLQINQIELNSSLANNGSLRKFLSAVFFLCKTVNFGKVSHNRDESKILLLFNESSVVSHFCIFLNI